MRTIIIINHITYSVSDITEAVLFYNKLFRKLPIAYGETLVCYDLEKLKRQLEEVNIPYELGRIRHSNEFESVYVRDVDMNLIEFHTGNLEDRLLHYKEYRNDIKISEAL